MNTFTSIESIEPQDVYQTGNTPMRVHCNNFEDYVCKYNPNYSSADLLAREYLAASLLNIWELSPPVFDLIFIKREHLTPGLPIGAINYECPCFGSKFNREYRELDAFISQTTKSKFSHPQDFLKIAFFDIWVSNEDRHPGNYNLLIAVEDDKFVFKPIDHGASFHTGNQGRENYTLSYEESLLSSPLVKRLFNKSLLKNEGNLEVLRDTWYLCHVECGRRKEGLIANMPEEWLIPKVQLKDEIEKFMFSDEWFSECWDTFIEYLNITLNQ